MKKILLIILLIKAQLTFSQVTNWQHFSNGAIKDLQVVGDTSWILTIDGLYEWNKGTNHKFLFNRDNTGIYFENSNKLYIDRSHRVWVTLTPELNLNDSNYYFLAMYDGIQWQQYAVATVSNEVIGGIKDIKENSQGKLFFGIDHGFMTYNNSTFTIDTVVGFKRYSNYVQCLEIDRFDRIWLGTTSGYFMYDGIFHDYALPGFIPWFTQPVSFSGGVNAIAFEKNDEMWLGSNDGCSGASGVYKQMLNGSIISLAHPNSPQQWWAVSLLCIDTSGVKWIYSNSRWYSYDNNNWNCFTGLDSCLWFPAIFIDNNNTKWFGSASGDLYSFNNQSWNSYRLTDCPIRNFQFNNIAIDSRNNYYFGSQGLHFILKYDGVQWQEIEIPHDQYRHFESYYVAIDKTDKVWITSMFDSVMVFDGQSWTVFNSMNSPLSSFRFFWDFKCDDQNRMWFVSNDINPVVYCFDNGIWNTYDFGQLFSAYGVQALETGNGKVWISYVDQTYNSHVVEFDGTNWISRYSGSKNFYQTRYSNIYGLLAFDSYSVYSDLITTNGSNILHTLNNESIKDVIVDDSTLCIITFSSLYLFNPLQNSYNKFNSGFHGKRNLCGAIDKNHNILIGNNFLNIFSKYSTLGIREALPVDELQVFYESKGKFVIHSQEIIMNYSIYDINAKLIRNIKSNSFDISIDLSSDIDGIYMIDVFLKNSHQVVKLIK